MKILHSVSNPNNALNKKVKILHSVSHPNNALNKKVKILHSVSHPNNALNKKVKILHSVSHPNNALNKKVKYLHSVSHPNNALNKKVKYLHSVSELFTVLLCANDLHGPVQWVSYLQKEGNSVLHNTRKLYFITVYLQNRGNFEDILTGDICSSLHSCYW